MNKKKEYFKTLTDKQLKEIRAYKREECKLITQVLKERYNKEYIERTNYKEKYKQKNKQKL